MRLVTPSVGKERVRRVFQECLGDSGTIEKAVRVRAWWDLLVAYYVPIRQVFDVVSNHSSVVDAVTKPVGQFGSPSALTP